MTRGEAAHMLLVGVTLVALAVSGWRVAALNREVTALQGMLANGWENGAYTGAVVVCQDGRILDTTESGADTLQEVAALCLKRTEPLGVAVNGLAPNAATQGSNNEAVTRYGWPHASRPGVWCKPGICWGLDPADGEVPPERMARKFGWEPGCPDGHVR